MSRHRPPWWTLRRWIRPVTRRPRGARAQAAVASVAAAADRDRRAREESRW